MAPLLQTVLLLTTLLTGVTANPLSARYEAKMSCDTIDCLPGLTCRMIGGRAECLPTPTVDDHDEPKLTCNTVNCRTGTICKMRDGKPKCVRSGGGKGGLTCANVRCAGGPCKMVDGKPTCQPAGGEKCGPNVCAADMVCCNASCGKCTKPGMMCTQEACLPPKTPGEEEGLQCGPNKCAAGQTCCNESCGTCVEEGGFCTQQFCGLTE